MKRVYEVLKHYSVIETYHVLATSEDEAIELCAYESDHFSKSYDGDIETIDQIWSIEDYKKEFDFDYSEEL
jgi:hypothetical protein